MSDEQTNTTDTSGIEASKTLPITEQPVSIVEEAKKIRDEIKAENDRRENILKQEQKLAADNMLGGTAGGHVDAAPPKVDTPEEYVDKAMSGALNKND